MTLLWTTFLQPPCRCCEEGAVRRALKKHFKGMVLSKVCFTWKSRLKLPLSVLMHRWVTYYDIGCSRMAVSQFGSPNGIVWSLSLPSGKIVWLLHSSNFSVNLEKRKYHIRFKALMVLVWVQTNYLMYLLEIKSYHHSLLLFSKITGILSSIVFWFYAFIWIKLNFFN